MTTHQVDLSAAFHTALAAAGRSADIPEADDAYGWLVGSWSLDVLRYYGADVSARRIKAEVHAAWTLEGRAVQDLWIMPPRGQWPPNNDKTGQPDKRLSMYGTTLRAWDASIRAWRITWSNPFGEHFEQQIGRRSGAEIIQLGTRADGTVTRWRFVEITRDSFHWLGEALAPDGQTWNVEGEFEGQRSE